MSDLISREKVDKAIREYFKSQIDSIPKDKGSEYAIDRVDIILEHNKGLIDAIEKIPVDFDVNKVVYELGNMKSDINHLAETNCQLGNYPMATICDAQTSILASAIEIVKKGVIE